MVVEKPQKQHNSSIKNHHLKLVDHTNYPAAALGPKLIHLAMNHQMSHATIGWLYYYVHNETSGQTQRRKHAYKKQEYLKLTSLQEVLKRIFHISVWHFVVTNSFMTHQHWPPKSEIGDPDNIRNLTVRVMIKTLNLKTHYFWLLVTIIRLGK